MATKEERDIMKKRFARMYPRNKPLSDYEADVCISAVKTSRMWHKLVAEEKKQASSLQRPEIGFEEKQNEQKK